MSCLLYGIRNNLILLFSYQRSHTIKVPQDFNIRPVSVATLTYCSEKSCQLMVSTPTPMASAAMRRSARRGSLREQTGYCIATPTWLPTMALGTSIWVRKRTKSARRFMLRRPRRPL